MSIPKIPINFILLAHGKDLDLPAYESNGAAGMDLRAAIAKDEDFLLEPLSRVLMPTGIAMSIPAGFEAQVRPRSGLSIKHGVTVINAPGTIDSDYRGEIKVPLINFGAEAFNINRGMRIAQLVICPVVQAALTPADALDETDRGSGGFGSTGSGS